MEFRKMSMPDIKIEKHFEMPTRFHKCRSSNNEIVKVVVVGCGGTGSRLVPLLAQHISNHNKAVDMNLPTVKINTHMSLHLIDKGDDPLEERNLRRQAFYKFDVGLPKAEALAKRMSALYGIPVTFKNEAFSELYSVNPSSSGSSYIVFDATDNIQARTSIEKVIFTQYIRNVVLISCGNEDLYGQIHVSYRNESQATLGSCAKLFWHIKDGRDREFANYFIPSFVMSNPDFKDSPALSCEQMLLIDDQSMPINNLIASVAFNAFYTILAEDKIKYYRANANVYNQYHSYQLSQSNLLKMLANIIVGVGEDNIQKASELVTDFLKIYGEHNGYGSWNSFSGFLQTKGIRRNANILA
jgi:molybdopterin/thiamine biosynthesis adenylyltransferase